MIGKRVRLERIIDRNTRRTVIVPMDHGMTKVRAVIMTARNRILVACSADSSSASSGRGRISATRSVV